MEKYVIDNQSLPLTKTKHKTKQDEVISLILNIINIELSANFV